MQFMMVFMKQRLLNRNCLIDSNTESGSLKFEGWMRTKDVARYLSTSPNNVRNLVYEGLLKFKSLKGRKLYRREWVDQMIEAQGVPNGN
jgi:hypothetical protein